ncbi:B12-binding domain-containing radical SAM protein [Labrenzia sp. DG1229]|uniref:B12-binding domain-containing radical SAM protein n=1 Tax=Labrenzia sp. DG1229 TaxID=681847 RepID=UPI000563D7AA|nr:B12-binding domain-containing radical SAM protein [Labrenzia sp. DG1229]
MRLGLIAMSGIRVQNTDLMQLGLTLPGFVERSKVVASLPSLALLTLAGLTPSDVHVCYLEVADLAALDDLPCEIDAVAISSYSAQIRETYALADRYRREGTKVILGGLHITACPQEAGRHADAIVLGEAEPVWRQVVQDLKDEDLKPVYDARSLSFDLQNAPMPAFELLDFERYNRLTVQTQRGCPLSCDFCASSIRISPKFKTKPVEKVIAEIHRIKDIWAKPFIELADDNTFANKAHAKRLVKALADEKIRWFTETDVSVADDPELLAMLRDAGCSQLLIGLEATDKAVLDGIEQKTNWKAKRADTYLEAVRRIQEHGITVNGCFVLGLDGQTEESFDAVINFVRESGLYDVQVTVQTPFPGTPLHDRLKSEGRLIRADAWETCTLFDVNFQPDGMTVEELENRFKNLVATLYTDNFTQWRHGAFRRQMRTTTRFA